MVHHIQKSWETAVMLEPALVDFLSIKERP